LLAPGELCVYVGGDKWQAGNHALQNGDQCGAM
jgi:hypothetical protein